jgi:hypothetical protein
VLSVVSKQVLPDVAVLVIGVQQLDVPLWWCLAVERCCDAPWLFTAYGACYLPNVVMLLAWNMLLV